MDLRGGELVGVAGLEGSGQREFLKALFFARHRTAGQVEKAGRLAYVTGDRGKEGVFPLWSIFDNMSLVEVAKSRLFRGLDLRALAEKVGQLVREALHQGARRRTRPSWPSPAGTSRRSWSPGRSSPTRTWSCSTTRPRASTSGPSTRCDALFREAAEGGKLVIWYSTEDEELEVCSRVLVFRYGRIVKELAGPEVTKQRIIEASFAGEDTAGAQGGGGAAPAAPRADCWSPSRPCWRCSC